MNILDTETCGFVGPMVLLQYKTYGESDVTLYNAWTNESSRTLDVIEKLTNSEIVGFNLTYDWFHLSKIYNIIRYLQECIGTFKPIDHIRDLWLIERYANKWCLKPKAACDLMLVSRRGPFQSLMERKPIRIRKVPTLLVHPLIRELKKRLNLPNIYFAKSEHKDMTWSITDTDKPELKNLVLNFRPDGGLKSIHHFLYNKGAKFFDEIGLDPWYYPEEYPYAPHSGPWPDKILYHIKHWETNSEARKYATEDVTKTEDVYNHPEFGKPTPGDNDSELACLVGTVRWGRLAVNLHALETLRNKTLTKIKEVPTAPKETWAYLSPYLDEFERKILAGSTKKEVIKKLAKREGELGKRAKDVLDTRQYEKRVEMYEKLLQAGALYASLNITGTLSNRMSGTDKLNVQGIPREWQVRACFPFTLDDNYELWGGDFDQFEVVIGDAEFKDPLLHEALKADKKIHALFAMEMYPEMSYDDIMKTKGTVDDKYGKGKNGVFTMMYGGDENTLIKKYGVPEDIAKGAVERWNKKYVVMAKRRQEIFDMFCTMKQKGGIGTFVEWNEPAEYIESFLGFRRYFTLEMKICRIFYDLAQSPPKEWRDIKCSVTRRDRIQSGSGAVQSALYGAAFGIQGACMRAAGNHVIQSPGAEANKAVQRAIWECQPTGVNRFLVKPLNIHDEIMCVTHKSITEKVEKVVNDTVESFRPKIPLIKFEWGPLNTWADK